MEVYSLIGTSGTGKSSNAIAFAYEHKIPAIIDDGLLIYEGEKVAGTSAKFEKTMIAAVKTAIFIDDQAAEEVIQKIKELKIEQILIIGTSLRMVDKIANRLKIAPINKHYFIESILSPEEIKQAQHERTTKGTHIIPLSYKQLEQNVLQKIIQKGIDIFSPHKEKIGETTIVRPYFHRRLLAKLRKKNEKRAEKKLQKRAEKEEVSIYRSQRRYVYIESMKEQYAKLIPELMNYINEKIADLKDTVVYYYNISKRYMYEVMIQLLSYMYQLLRRLVNQYELLVLS